jgi:hypothetical protein
VSARGPPTLEAKKFAVYVEDGMVMLADVPAPQDPSLRPD